MANLRIIDVKVPASTQIVAEFTDTLATDLTIDNVLVTSETPNIADPKILSVSISGTKFTIDVLPLTPLAAFTVKFKSTNTVRFRNTNSTSFLIEDDRTNQRLILGPEDASNPITTNILAYLRENGVYDLEEGTIVNNFVRMLGAYLGKAMYDIGQVKNENYLSKSVFDEQKVRGSGPFDRLNEEAAYEILRVAKNRTGYTATKEITVDNFPSHLVSLRQETITDEELELASSDTLGKFNINTFTLNVAKNNVIQLDKVIFFYSTLLPNGLSYYEYDIPSYGYQLKDERYDLDYGFKYSTLETNQFRLSEKILQDSNFSLDNITYIRCTYKYKNLGRIIDPTSLTVTHDTSVAREVIEPLVNIFNLKNYPIINSAGNVATVSGVEFLDPNANPALSDVHPAFTTEIPFSFEQLPTRAGEYSVDYETGTVYVFGEDAKNDGTGAYPPLASYKYRSTYQNLIDYVYDSDEADLVALPNRDLVGESADINFSYQDVLVPGLDYKADVHKEVLSERVENRIVPTINGIKVKNSPITNVFRVFNETQGQVYSVTRWNNDTIYFEFASEPNVENLTGERVSFQTVMNELLFVNQELTNTSALRIFKIELENSNIISSTEDSIGSSFNSSLTLANSNIFTKEVYFDSDALQSVNLDRLSNEGEYMVDYRNGILYAAVSSSQSYDLGTVSYKRSYIAPQNPHITNPIDIYFRRDLLQPKDKTFSFSSFGEGYVIPENLESSDEKFLNGDSAYPYFFVSGSVGTYIDATFTPGITNNIKSVRGLYEYSDLVNNPSPINFSDFTTVSDKSLEVSPKVISSLQIVEQSGSDFFVNAGIDLEYLSSNFTISFTVTRVSDSAELWNGSGTYTLGTPLRLELPGINSPAAGDNVIVTVTIAMNDDSRVVVDYDKGEYYIDYTYLADEIVVSYEYGENHLDFRESTALSEGDEYYVTYRVGALRDALLKNFGSLIDIPILNVFDNNFERERYREALLAAMSSFIEGPTIGSMKRIIETISHIEPEISESIFENWSLGNSFLYPEAFKANGNPITAKGRYGNGLLLNSEGQSVTFPSSSNLKIGEGTFSTWITPQWNGIDNDSKLKFLLKKDGAFVSGNEVFIGAAEYHPALSEDEDGNLYFEVSRRDTKSPMGKPNKKKDGIYIYLEKDGYGGDTVTSTGDYYRWYVDIVDAAGTSQFNVDVHSDGEFYDVKQFASADGYTDGYTSLTSHMNKVYFQTTTNHHGLTFVSDYSHYILDYGEEKKNRISLYKDVAGYLNFRIIDKDANQYTVSADVSGWKAHQKHHVAVSWILNSKDERDEIHLFVDGAEVPNIIRYGQRFPLFYGQKFRTVNPEEIASEITANIIAGTDLVTTAGSDVVTASTSFSGAGIEVGDTLYVDEFGFSSSGYTVTSVDGNSLTLSTVMPLSVTDGEFSVNKTEVPVDTRIDVYPRIAVFVVHSVYSASDGVVASDVLTSASTDFIALGITPGYLINVDGLPETHFTVTAVSTNSVTLDRAASSSGSGYTFYIYDETETELRGVNATQPDYEISKDSNGDNIIVIRNGAQKGDLVRVRSFGSSFKNVRETYYAWGDTSNILRTRLPRPISLDEVEIRKILLSPVAIGLSNATVSGSDLLYTTTEMDQPVTSDDGRTLQVDITAGSNVTFSTPTTVTINGNTSGGAVSEVITFNAAGREFTANKFLTITSIDVQTTPSNIASSTNAIVLAVREAEMITTAENSATVASIQFSYQVRFGTTLNGSGTVVTDLNGLFSTVDVGNYLHVFSGPAAGYYKISEVSADHKTATLETSLAGTATDATYEILNTTTERSGLQNGVFRFENAAVPGQAYNLTKGLYEFTYATYISAKFDPKRGDVYLGASIGHKHQVNAVLDTVKIETIKLGDIRKGEVEDASIGSITSEYNSLKRPEAKKTTTVLLTLDSSDPKNEADFYVSTDRNYLQVNRSVNTNFSQSLLLQDKPIKVDNLGILNTRKEGTIEFWVSPVIDTKNDPAYRFYFDATGNVSEKVVSSGRTSLKISGNASQIVSVRLQNGDSGKNYFGVGSIGSDKKTITLQYPLPHQNTPVVVSYVPTGLNGDRISIYKDPYGYLTFNMKASGTDYQIRVPIFWTAGTWHRVKATYKINGGKKKDEIRLFVDGFERGNVLYGTGLVYGTGVVYGQAFVGQSNIITTIKFNDTVNEFVIGGDYNGVNSANALIDNLRISDVSRPGYVVFGESVDVSYNANTGAAFPVTKDLYTTYLLDIDTLSTRNTDFALLKNKNYGIFDFSVNILDSFAILKNSSKTKEVLETLIKTLKPANSRVFIEYDE